MLERKRQIVRALLLLGVSRRIERTRTRLLPCIIPSTRCCEVLEFATLPVLSSCRQCSQIWAAHHRATMEERPHERQATYVWARRFGYLHTVQEYRRTIFFPTPSRRLLTVWETLNLRLFDVNELLLSYSKHPIHLHILARQRFSACEKGNRINVRTHINAHFAHYLVFCFTIFT